MQAIVFLTLFFGAAAVETEKEFGATFKPEYFHFLSMKNQAEKMAVDVALNVLKHGPKTSAAKEEVATTWQKKNSLIESDKAQEEPAAPKTRYYGKKVDIKAEEAKRVASVKKVDIKAEEAKRVA